MKFNILFRIAFSKIFDKVFRREIGRKFEGSEWAPDLYNGIIFAIFKRVGKKPDAKE